MADNLHNEMHTTETNPTAPADPWAGKPLQHTGYAAMHYVVGLTVNFDPRGRMPEDIVEASEQNGLIVTSDVHTVEAYVKEEDRSA